MESAPRTAHEANRLGDKNIKNSATVIGGLFAAGVAAVMGFNVMSSTLKDWKDWNAGKHNELVPGIIHKVFPVGPRIFSVSAYNQFGVERSYRCPMGVPGTKPECKPHN